MTERDGLRADTEDQIESASCEQVRSTGVLGKLKLWVARNIVADVPTEIARCEFECRVAHCPPDKIQACQRRIDYARMLTVSDVRPEPASD